MESAPSLINQPRILSTHLPLKGSSESPLVPEVGVIALVSDAWSEEWQPRHQVVLRLARYFQVAWLGPLPNWSEVFQPTAVPKIAFPGFKVYKPGYLLPSVHRPQWLRELSFRFHLNRARRQLMRQGARKIVLYLWRPEYSQALNLVPHDLSCYHLDDEYSFSPVETTVDENEACLLRNVDRVIVHSPGLYEKKGGFNPNTTVISNGVDYDSFSSPVAEPRDLADIPHPRIGYTGVLKRQLDWNLLLYLAKCHPEWSFVFVGPTAPHQEIRSVMAELSQQPNVYFLGSKPVWELGAYPQHFDVCIMPYISNDYTKYIYPLKLHEYLASGRPVVSTRIRSLEGFEHMVGLPVNPQQWSSMLLDALSPSANTKESRAARQAVACEHDWELLVARVAAFLAAGSDKSVLTRLKQRLSALPGAMQHQISPAFKD